MTLIFVRVGVWFMPAQAIENLKAKDIAQRLGLGKRGTRDLDWGQFDWYHGMYYIVQFTKKLGMRYAVLLRQTPAQLKNNS